MTWARAGRCVGKQQMRSTDARGQGKGEAEAGGAFMLQQYLARDRASKYRTDILANRMTTVLPGTGITIPYCKCDFEDYQFKFRIYFYLISLRGND